MKTRLPADGHVIRLGLRTPHRNHGEVKKLTNLCAGARRILQIAGQSAKGAKRTSAVSAKVSRLHSQKSAVRVTYSIPKSPGHWKAHGTYMQRESAAGPAGGFTRDAEGVQIPETLNSWQKAGDERIFKLIISPENGTHLNMETYAKDVMKAVEKDLGLDLEWVAAVHINTDHPHVHVAVRGIFPNGKPLKFERDFVKNGFRFHAEKVATIKLGFRTQQDIQKATVKEITQDRFTNLDRQISKARPQPTTSTPQKTFTVEPADPVFSGFYKQDAVNRFALERRLSYLGKMNLAYKGSDGRWEVTTSFAKTLQTVQMVGDRQKMMAQQMEAASSTDLPQVLSEWKDIQVLQGRILGHAEEEASDRRSLFVEGIDGKVYHLPHRKDTEELRAQKQLRKNEFVTITRDKGRIQFVEMGHAEDLLHDSKALAHLPFRPKAGALRPGWLGRFDVAVSNAQHSSQADKRDVVAVALTETQLGMLIGDEYPKATFQQRREIIEKVYATSETVTILGGKGELDYSEKSRLAFVQIERHDKTTLDQRLATLTTQQNAKQQARRERQTTAEPEKN